MKAGPVTSDRKREANRANARRSTGPRSSTGKRRASRNAVKHGLAVKLRNNPAWHTEVEDLAQAYAPGCVDAIAMSFARNAADAQLCLQQVRHARTAFFWEFTRPGAAAYVEPREVHSIVRAMNKAWKGNMSFGELRRLTKSIRLPGDEPARSVGFLRRGLDRLRLFAQYESRAAARRDRALLRMQRRVSDVDKQ